MVRKSFLIESLVIYYRILGNWIFLSILLALSVAALDIAGISLFVPIVQNIFENTTTLGFGAAEDHISFALSKIFNVFAIPQTTRYFLLILFVFIILMHGDIKQMFDAPHPPTRMLEYFVIYKCNKSFYGKVPLHTFFNVFLAPCKRDLLSSTVSIR